MDSAQSSKVGGNDSAAADPEMWWQEQHYSRHSHLYEALVEPVDEKTLLQAVDACLDLMVNKQRKILRAEMESDFDTEYRSLMGHIEEEGEFMIPHIRICILRLRHLKHLLQHGVPEKHPWYSTYRLMRPFYWATSEFRQILDQAPLSPIFLNKKRYVSLLERAKTLLIHMLECQEKLRTGLWKLVTEDHSTRFHKSVQSLFEQFNLFWQMHHLPWWRQRFREAVQEALQMKIVNPVERVTATRTQGLVSHRNRPTADIAMTDLQIEELKDRDRKVLLRGYVFNCQPGEILPYFTRVAEPEFSWKFT